MDILIEDLNQNAQFEKKITTLCSFNNIKRTFKQGKILTIKNTNISFIQPHQIEIIIKDKKILLIYFNEDNLFLYNRTLPIDTKKLDILIKDIKNN